VVGGKLRLGEGKGGRKGAFAGEGRAESGWGSGGWQTG